MSDVEVITGCPTPTKANGICKMRPTNTGYCLNHDPNRGEARHAERSKGGKLARAREVLRHAKADAIAKLGIEEPLPDLADVQSCQQFLKSVAGWTLRREISPSQANSLVAVVKASKDLVSLALDLKLAEALEDDS